MPERFLHRVCAIELPEEGFDARLAELKSGFPPRATRRMSTLGIMLAHCLKDTAWGEDTGLVYATSFTESRALERYLASFPDASPMGFQSSIHPSGVEQALILRQHPVREFFPLAGRAGIALQALRTAFLVASDHVVLCGGEERGTWLNEVHLASDRTFAFAVELTRQSEGAIATLSWDASAPAEDPEVSGVLDLGLDPVFSALLRRKDCLLAHPELGRAELRWR